MKDQAIQDAIHDFQKHFGVNEEVEAYYQSLNGEEIIVVENYYKRAFYTANIQLIKVNNLREEM